MADRIPVRRDGEQIYDIVIEDSFQGLARELTGLRAGGRRACIVTDSNVERLYLEEVKEIAASCFAGVETFVFPAGERHKNLDTVQRLYEKLIESRLDRQDFLLALGGGVTGDLCGFAAATYLRGISFVQIPTTLLSQVDSSIGGKTGVDFDSYKNMVGAFHMPRLVYTNTRTLLTLPDDQFSSGMGEIVKHGLIKSREYYNWLEAHAEEINGRNLSVCGEMISASDRIKREVVESDPEEKGERALLNFGHTLGHAIEKLSDFSLLHGHCVGLGCIAAAGISASRSLISREEAERARHLMERFHIPASLSGMDAEEIVKTTKNDKKMDSGKIRFILLNHIGEACIDNTVTDEEMRAGLSAILE